MIRICFIVSDAKLCFASVYIFLDDFFVFFSSFLSKKVMTFGKSFDQIIEL